MHFSTGSVGGLVAVVVTVAMAATVVTAQETPAEEVPAPAVAAMTNQELASLPLEGVLAALAKNPLEEERILLYERLRILGKQQTATVVDLFCTTEDADQEVMLGQLLCDLGPEIAFPALATYLEEKKDEASLVVMDSLRGLKWHGNERLKKNLLGLLASKNLAVQAEAVELVAESGDLVLLPVWLDKYATGTGAEMPSLLAGLQLLVRANVKQPEVAACFREALGKMTDPEKRRQYYGILSDSRSEETGQLVRERWDRDRDTCAREMLEILVRCGDPEAGKYLVGELAAAEAAEEWKKEVFRKLKTVSAAQLSQDDVKQLLDLMETESQANQQEIAAVLKIVSDRDFGLILSAWRGWYLDRYVKGRGAVGTTGKAAAEPAEKTAGPLWSDGTGVGETSESVEPAAAPVPEE